MEGAARAPAATSTTNAAHEVSAVVGADETATVHQNPRYHPLPMIPAKNLPIPTTPWLPRPISPAAQEIATAATHATHAIPPVVARLLRRAGGHPARRIAMRAPTPIVTMSRISLRESPPARVGEAAAADATAIRVVAALLVMRAMRVIAACPTRSMIHARPAHCARAHPCAINATHEVAGAAPARPVCPAVWAPLGIQAPEGHGRAPTTRATTLAPVGVTHAIHATVACPARRAVAPPVDGCQADRATYRAAVRLVRQAGRVCHPGAACKACRKMIPGQRLGWSIRGCMDLGDRWASVPGARRKVRRHLLQNPTAHV